MPSLESPPLPHPHSRKDKKKQAKEERDRQKQVEKKKRRLEKALATAAAIRIELEKKKQRRKEEEQRLDEEGAALAEAVALQVLVEEEAESSLHMSSGLLSASSQETDDVSCAESRVPPSPRIPLKNAALDVKLTVSPVLPADDCIRLIDMGKAILPAAAEATSDNGKKNREEMLLVHKPTFVADWQMLCAPNDSLKASSERAKAAELAAAMAAAQAVAALRIAEEARAEAEAAKKAAEAAISEVLVRTKLANVESVPQMLNQTPTIEMERDELKARLEETERQLKERTRQVACLEQSLEDMTQYLLHLKAKLPHATSSIQKQSSFGESSDAGTLYTILSLPHQLCVLLVIFVDFGDGFIISIVCEDWLNVLHGYFHQFNSTGLGKALLSQTLENNKAVQGSNGQLYCRCDGVTLQSLEAIVELPEY